MLFLAHGIGGVRDLPVPPWIFYWGGAIVLVASFVGLALLWQSPLLARKASGREAITSLRWSVAWRVARLLLQTASVLLFVLVCWAALFGTNEPLRNLAPTWVYVVFWLGLPLLSVLFGDVWRVLSPWRALAGGVVWVMKRTGQNTTPLARYPERWGRWPGAVTLFAFIVLELAYSDASSPRTLGFAIAIYSYVTFLGYAAFGRDTWDTRGEGFAIMFAYLARIAPVTVAEGRIRLRPPFTGLAGTEPIPGSLAVIAVMLGSVAFDGFSRTSWWQDLQIEVQAPYIVDQPGLAELLGELVSVGVILALTLVVGAAYWLATALMRSTVQAPRSLFADFVLSLVPIAFVYAVAHYFTLFVVQGQFTFPLLSDPLGRGWDLIGLADYQPNLAPFSPNTVWYVQAGALIAGHVAGLAVAHDRAVMIFRSRTDALRSQYAMLALMVAYTVGGLWLLSRG